MPLTQKALFAAIIILLALTLSAQIVDARNSVPLTASKKAELKYEEARRDFYTLFSSDEKRKDRKYWERVIARFDDISRLFPKTRQAADATYTVGLLYERLFKREGSEKDKDKALKNFEAVVTNYPQSTLVDDAQRHIGDIRFIEKKYGKAKSAYKKAKKSSAKVTKLEASTKKGISAKSKPKKKYNDHDSVARLTSVESFARDGYTRVILNLSSPTAYRSKKLNKPGRVFIDLLDTRKDSKTPKVTHFAKGVASSLRIAQNQSSVTRVVIDLNEENTYHSVSALHEPFRIVIDVGRAKKKARAPTRIAKAKVKTKSKKTTAKKRVATRKTTKYKNSSIRTIVIDPGHGGKDPGAVGPTGLKEKTVTLAIAKKLKKELERRMRCRVILTRTWDRYLALDERTVIANSLNADLFISIHVNASRNRRAHGVETYFLSPARSKDELATASRENMLALKSGNTIENDLAYIMSDLTSTQKVNDSVSLAKNVQHAMIKKMRRSYSGVKDKGVKQAMFYVLWRATMPSILLETGFITNRSEERRLRSSRYISKLATSIADGVTGYSRTYLVANR